jgi:hypothetical protein
MGAKEPAALKLFMNCVYMKDSGDTKHRYLSVEGQEMVHFSGQLNNFVTFLFT